MFQLTHLQTVFLAACASALLASPLAAAQDRDAEAAASYVLTETSLAKYMKATKNLAALPASKPGDCDADAGADSLSLDEMVAVYDGVPGAKAAIQSAGMTTREYVLFMWSLLHNGLAAWTISQPGGKLPPGTSKANVDFYQQHAAELQQLEAVKQGEDCDAESAEEEPEE